MQWKTFAQNQNINMTPKYIGHVVSTYCKLRQNLEETGDENKSLNTCRSVSSRVQNCNLFWGKRQTEFFEYIIMFIMKKTSNLPHNQQHPSFHWHLWEATTSPSDFHCQSFALQDFLLKRKEVLTWKNFLTINTSTY